MPTRPPHRLVVESRRSVEGPLALLSDPRESDVLVRLERVSKEIARLRREGRAFPPRKPTQRVVDGTLEDDVHTRVLRRHKVECSTSDTPKPYVRRYRLQMKEVSAG